MAKLGDYLKTEDFKKEKHVPVIEGISGVKSGVPFTVNVTVGKEIPHPNTTEHYISWIKLYFMPDGGKFIYEVGSSIFSAHGASADGPNKGPVYSNSTASFNIKLDVPGKLIAESCCNIHGLWESSADIIF
ncbi:MAG: class II SORL domain-containing protein [Brevinematales bacterium]|jgi:superoxide reductase